MSMCVFFGFFQLYFNTICFPVFAICFLFLTISSLSTSLPSFPACVWLLRPLLPPLKPAAAVGHSRPGALQEVDGAALLPQRPRCALRVRRHLPDQLQQPDLLGGGVQEELARTGHPQVATANASVLV